jgi:hypothetical protein
MDENRVIATILKLRTYRHLGKPIDKRESALRARPPFIVERTPPGKIQEEHTQSGTKPNE